MKLLAVLRNKAFWIMDSVKGSFVKAAYEELKRIDELDSDDPYIKEYQENAWRLLKERATTTVDAYLKFASNEFGDFPVITKQDIKENQSKYLSSDYSKDKLIQMRTSGSTGTPFVCYQNIEKKKRVNAEIIYYSEKVGYKLGENLSYVRTVVKQNKKSRLKQFMQNQTLIQCVQLNDSGIEVLINALEKLSTKGSVTLLAYGSTYTVLKDYFLKKGIKILGKCNVTGVISGSDMLFDETREKISKVFGNIPVVSRYSNEENGVLGQDEGMNNVFTLNEADYIVEILDDNDNAVEDGTLGRIVVTDLFNYAMPMIRYDTGDVGAVQMFNINGRKKKCICQFSGRKVDIITDAEGNTLSPHVITNYMWDFPEVMQFQIIQTSREKYTLKLIVDSEFQREQELLIRLKELLGHQAEINIIKVDEIPVMASGKRRYIVNEYKNA